MKVVVSIGNLGSACFTSLTGCFSLIKDQHAFHVPLDRFVESHPCADVFALYRKGALAPGTSVTLQTGQEGTGLATRPGEIEIGGQTVALRSHALGMPVFLCRCGHDAYRLYEVGGAWACRKCHKLDYACRHRHRSIPGLNRIAWLRRRLRADPRPFTPLPLLTPWHHAKRRLAAEIMALEAALVDHVRTAVCDVLEQRDDDRINRRQERTRRSRSAQP